jgi:hypothetical protein
MHALRQNHEIQGLNIACSQLSYGCIKDIQNMFRHNKTLLELWLAAN